jgi:ATP-dependent Lon protease
MGGTIIYIEVTVDIGATNNSFTLTGQLGDVMKESTRIALTCAKTFLAELQPNNDFFQKVFHLNLIF